MLEVHRSNRADRLVQHLAERLATDPLEDPMVSERIGVQSRGMARWLSHHLAERLGADGRAGGITANVDFPFPGRVIGEVIAACVEDADPTARDPWQPDHLVWPVLDLLPTLRAPGSDRVRSYLRDEDQTVGRRRWGLSRRIADVLDRYAMFRPEMVRAWGDGRDDGPEGAPLDDTQLWQPELWRGLEGRLGATHVAARFDAAIGRLRAGTPAPEGLPPRLTLFGTSALAPAYLEVLAALATRIDVALYVIVPSPVLWGRIRTAAASGGADEVRPEHPLLVSSGRLAQDFQRVLERRAAHTGEELFEEPPLDTALGRLQDDLLTDTDRGDPTRSDGAAAAELREDDDSIRFHACHGPGRQVEVLHDLLLHLFEDHPDLEPRDVIVMTPDVETYAPLITAVFERSEGTEGRTIPYRIADRTLRGTNQIAAALLDLLELSGGRFAASKVNDLIGREPVRRAAQLSEDDLGRIQGWIASSGIRWGIDPEHRAAHGQPADRDHTWRAGLDRLLLGVAMPDEDDRHVHGVVPYDDMEGGDVELLGRFVGLCGRLSEVATELREPRPIAAWATTLTAVIDDLTEVDEERRWVRDEVVAMLEGLAENAAAGAGGSSEPPLLAADAVRSLIEGSAQDTLRRAAYETGAVTFCAMIPMRSIPHRVVCLLGMDDGAFPGRARPAGFDLVADHPRTGDRDPSGEDRLLLLEALLAARDHFVVLYTGRDHRTNEERAPAVPIGELRDVLDRAHRHEPKDRGSVHHRSASVRLTTEHPLQAWSPRNFASDRPLSFADEQLDAARAARLGETVPWRFFPEPLPAPDDDGDGAVVELAELARFLRGPTAWLYANRLGLWLREQRHDISDTEPVTTDPLGSWRIGDRLLAVRLEGADRDARVEALLGRGTIPTGALGAYEIDDVDRVVERIETELRSVAPDWIVSAGDDRPTRDLPIDIRIGDRRLHGVVRGVRDGTLVEVQYSNLAPRHRLDLWVRHLALAAAYPEEDIRCVIVGRKLNGRGRPDSCVYAGTPSDEAEAHLAELIAIFDRGRCEPVPLFDGSSEAYARRLHEAGLDPQARDDLRLKALKDARTAWGSDFKRGDRDDAHVAHCYGEGCEFDDVVDGTDFGALAERVWAPVLEAEGRS